MSSVDIVVPCYNYAKYLRECVQSVLTQEGVDVRVLVIDDASSDETPVIAGELVQCDSRVSYRRHGRNLRHIATYNEGIEWVSAKYYLLLSADDYLLPGALVRAVNLLDADASLSFCYGATEQVYPDGRVERALAEFAPTPSTQSISMRGDAFIDLCRHHGCMNIVPTPTAVVRTDVQKRIEGYRLELPHSGDMELWLRLAAQGGVGYVGVPQAMYRRHLSNMSLTYTGANWLEDLRQREQAVEWFIRSCNQLLRDPSGVRKALLTQLGVQAVSCASRAISEGRSTEAREFAEFARTASPNVVFSSAWMRFLLKRLVGRRASTAILSARDALWRSLN